MNAPLFAPLGWAVPEPKALWPHQQRALAALRAALMDGYKRVVLSLPTGAGKTRIAAEIVQGSLAKGNPVAFTVPALSLVSQTVEAFEAEGIYALGVIQGIHERTDRSQPVQVCSVQTLVRRRFPKSRIVIVDECHISSKAVLQWMQEAPETIFIGLSATPWARGMGKHWETLVIGATIGELIEAGRLSEFRVYAPSHPDLSGVKIVAGEYADGELSQVMSERKIVADVVETWKRLGPGEKTLCFAVDRAHAAHLHREFIDGSVSCAYVDAFTLPEEREAIKRDFHSGAAQVVVSIGTLTTGIDWDVRCVSWARPTKSAIVWIQAIGRGLRTAEGKSYLTVLDHADTALTLGLPTEIHRDRLDDGKPRSAAEKAADRPKAFPRPCAACGVLKPPAVPFCPSCGHKPERQTDILVEDGELVEFGTKAPATEKYTSEQKAQIFGQLKLYAKRHGYAAGWAAHKFRERTGVWPNAYRDAPLREPSLELLAWMKSRQIAFAKRRKTA